MWAFPDAAALELRVAKINSDINAAMKAARDDRRRRERGLLLSELPAELLQLILYSVPLAHDIALAAPTCKVLSVAARNAFKVRPFSGEVVTLVGHTSTVLGLAAATDGRIITGSAGRDRTIKV